MLSEYDIEEELNNMIRTLFNIPIRIGITDEFFPRKMSIDEFQQKIVNSFESYKSNMNSLGSPANDDKYIEQWVEQYLSWLEIEQEK
jgi:hypothetical protein